MKKLLLSVLFILSISPLLAMVGTNVPIKADEIVIGGNSYVEDVITQSEYNRLNYSGLLAEFLKQGGTIDTTNINPDYGVDDVIEEIGETIYEVIKDTGQFVDWLGDSIFQSEGTIYPENIKPRMNTALADNMGIFLGLIPLLNSQVADLPVPTPPLDYQSYIDTINGVLPSCFFWGGSTLSFPNDSSYSNAVLNGNSQSFSYCSNSYGIVTGSTTTSTMYICPITDVYIVSTSENQYQFNTRFTATCWGQLDPNVWGSPIYCYTGQISGSTITPSARNAQNDYTGYYKNLTYSGTLVQCLEYLTNYCRNINIYVDGVPWSIVGSNSSYQITLNPTTITPVDEHGRVRWKYDEEIYIDIDLLWQLLDDLLNDPDRRIIRFSDIEDAIVDEDGQTAIAVKVVNDEDNIDEYYIKNYGSLIPVFPTDVSFPVSIDKMVSIVTVPVSVIPDDLMGVLKTLFIGTLMVCLLQRLLE